jgi:uncharacterized protein (DUF302 family)
MRTFRYGFETTLSNTTQAAAVERVTDELKKEGFGVLTEIDVKATLKKKLDVDFRPYAILGACNPALAKQGLEAEDQLGLLLPCNVVVQDLGDGRVSVSIADPKATMTLVENPAVTPVADEADRRLRRVVEALERGPSA